MKRTNLLIPEDIHTELRIEAALQSVSLSNIMCKALKEYLAKKKIQKQENKV